MSDNKQTPNERSVEEIVEEVLNKAYDLIEEKDCLISITERGLKKAIAEALTAANKRTEEAVRGLCEALYAYSCIYTCPGIAIGDGNTTGCTGVLPNDCPTCRECMSTLG